MELRDLGPPTRVYCLARELGMPGVQTGTVTQEIGNWFQP